MGPATLSPQGHHRDRTFPGRADRTPQPSHQADRRPSHRRLRDRRRHRPVGVRPAAGRGRLHRHELLDRRVVPPLGRRHPDALQQGARGHHRAAERAGRAADDEGAADGLLEVAAGRAPAGRLRDADVRRGRRADPTEGPRADHDGHPRRDRRLRLVRRDVLRGRAHGEHPGAVLQQGHPRQGRSRGAHHLGRDAVDGEEADPGQAVRTGAQRGRRGGRRLPVHPVHVVQRRRRGEARHPRGRPGRWTTGRRS